MPRKSISRDNNAACERATGRKHFTVPLACVRGYEGTGWFIQYHVSYCVLHELRTALTKASLLPASSTFLWTDVEHKAVPFVPSYPVPLYSVRTVCTEVRGASSKPAIWRLSRPRRRRMLRIVRYPKEGRPTRPPPSPRTISRRYSDVPNGTLRTTSLLATFVGHFWTSEFSALVVN